MDKLTSQYTDKICEDIQALPDDASADQIQQAAERLDAMNYQPILLIEPEDFLHITKDQLISFIREKAQNNNELTEQHLNLLVYQYRLLQRLRRDEPEAWDEVNELMEDD